MPDAATTDLQWNQPFLLAGRDPGADCVLDDPAVTRHHAYFQVLGSRVFAVDLDSRTGLLWDGGRAPWGWVGPERGVDIGPYRLRSHPAGMDGAIGDPVAWPEPIDDPLAAHPQAHLRLPRVVLEFPGKVKRRAWLMRQALLLIGRSPACRLHIDDPAISRFEAAIVRTPSGTWLVGLLGRSEVQVNGSVIRLAELCDGDTVQIGNFRLRVSLPSEQLALPASVSRRGRQLRSLPGLEKNALAHLAPTFANLSQVSGGPFATVESLQIAMQMMGQWFGALYHEHNARLQEEFSQLVRLNRELAELYGQLITCKASAEAPNAISGAAGEMPTPTKPSLPRTPADEPPPLKPSVGENAPGAHSQAAGDSVLHLQLIRRIETLQREQRGRWQRMVKIATGKP